MSQSVIVDLSDKIGRRSKGQALRYMKKASRSSSSGKSRKAEARPPYRLISAHQPDILYPTNYSKDDIDEALRFSVKHGVTDCGQPSPAPGLELSQPAPPYAPTQTRNTGLEISAAGIELKELSQAGRDIARSGPSRTNLILQDDNSGYSNVHTSGMQNTTAIAQTTSDVQRNLFWQPLNAAGLDDSPFHQRDFLRSSAVFEHSLNQENLKHSPFNNDKSSAFSPAIPASSEVPTLGVFQPSIFSPLEEEYLFIEPEEESVGVEDTVEEAWMDDFLKPMSDDWSV